MTRRVVASIVGFFLGWTVFQIVRPIEDLPQIHLSPPREIQAIKLESLGCTDAELECPVFEMILRSDGTASYVGHANDYFIGRFEGRIPQADFEYLVKEIEKQEFFEMPEHFDREQVLETITVEVVTNEGSHRVTSYSWDSMPGELRALHALIQYQPYYISWDEVK